MNHNSLHIDNNTYIIIHINNHNNFLIPILYVSNYNFHFLHFLKHRWLGFPYLKLVLYYLRAFKIRLKFFHVFIANLHFLLFTKFINAVDIIHKNIQWTVIFWWASSIWSFCKVNPHTTFFNHSIIHWFTPFEGLFKS